MAKLIEHIVEKASVIKENLPKGISTRVWYPIMRFGKINANRRIYEKAVADGILKDENILNKLKTRTLFGNQEHPAESQVKLSKDDTSHIISEFKIDEKNGILLAAFDIFPTEAGKFINVLLEAGCLVGVSTRADGELEEKIDESGQKYSRVIPESYRFQTVDFTGDPSTPNAVPENIVKLVQSHYENKTINENVAMALLENIKTEAAKTLITTIKEGKTHLNCECQLGDKKYTLDGSNLKEKKDGADKKLDKKQIKEESTNKGTSKSNSGSAKEKEPVKVSKTHVGYRIWPVEDFDKELLGNSFEVMDSLEDAKMWAGPSWFGGGKFRVLKIYYKDRTPIKGDAQLSGDEKDVKGFNWARAKNIVKIEDLGIYDTEKNNKIQEDVQLEMDIEPKIKEFIDDNWKTFLNNDNAIENLISIFKITPEKAKEYIDQAVEGKGEIEKIKYDEVEEGNKQPADKAAAEKVYQKSKAHGEKQKNEVKANEIYGVPKTDIERAQSHFDISDEEWGKLSKEKQQGYVSKLPPRGSGLVDESLLEAYRNEVISLSQKLSEKKVEVNDKLLKELKRNLNKENESDEKVIKTITGDLEEKKKFKTEIIKLKETINSMKKTNDTFIGMEDKLRLTESGNKQLKEKLIKEVKQLKENHQKELIKLYADSRVFSMGLKLPTSALTILESCKSKDEVNAEIRKFQDAIREGITQSVNLSEIVVGSGTPKNPEQVKIDTNVAKAFQGFGI